MIAVASAFYAAFIVRSDFRFEGRAFFALFDDAMVSMRFGRNLAGGDGLTWTAGGQVEGYSNFLWTMWMSFVHLLPISQPKTGLAIMVTSAALLLATMVVVRAICARLAPERPLLGTLAMALTGCFYPLVFWSLRGMEVGLAALLIALMVLLALRLEQTVTTRACWALGGVMAMAVLTRDDLLLPSLVVGVYAVWVAAPAARRRVLAIVGGILLVAVAGHTVFRQAYYGDALPNTYYVKLEGVPLGDRLERGGIALAYTWLFTLYAPLLLAAGYLIARRPLLRAAALLAAVVVVQSAYSLYVGGDVWEDMRIANRFIAPVVPLLMVLAALGIGELRSARGRRLAPWLAGAFAAMAVVISYDWLPVERLRADPYDGVRTASVAVAMAGAVLALALWRLRSAATVATVALAALVLVQVDARPLREWARDNADGVELDEYWARTGLILREHTSPQTTIAVVAAGNTPYFAERPAIDLLGKNDPVIAHRPPREGLFVPGHNKWDYEYSIGRLRPDVIHLAWAATPTDLCRLRAWGYRLVAQQVFVHRDAQVVRARTAGRRIAALGNVPAFKTPAHCPPSEDG